MEQRPRSDRLVPPIYGAAYRKCLPHAQWKLIKDCGHLPMFEKEAEFVAAFKPDAAPGSKTLVDALTALKVAGVVATKPATGVTTDVALVDRERRVFEIGPADQMIDPRKLALLYGREVRVAKVGDKTAIVMGDGAPP